MGFTYIDGSNLPLHQVRAKIGDTTQNAIPGLRLEDEVILAKLADNAQNVALASLDCIDQLLSRFAREADSGTKGAGLEATRRFERLLKLRALVVEEVEGDGGPSTAMLSRAFRDTQIADSDRIQPPTREGVFDFDV